MYFCIKIQEKNKEEKVGFVEKYKAKMTFLKKKGPNTASPKRKSKPRSPQSPKPKSFSLLVTCRREELPAASHASGEEASFQPPADAPLPSQSPRGSPVSHHLGFSSISPLNQSHAATRHHQLRRTESRDGHSSPRVSARRTAELHTPDRPGTRA